MKPIEDMTKDELLNHARDIGATVNTNMRKAEVLNAVKMHTFGRRIEQEATALSGVVVPDDRQELLSAAESHGIAIPDNWSDQQIRDALSAFETATNAPAPPPRPATGSGWTPGSPRG